jgi:replicative DNA helicase
MATATALVARLETSQEANFRVQPHNIEAEQALLGAILVNNDAFYRVSDFLQPEHFFEELHRRIFEMTASLIRAGKIATPITLKTFIGEIDLGGVTAPQYLARLAAEATTVINAGDYGRTIYDLAIRRQLINVGEELVNVAYDAPVEMAPREPDRGCRAQALCAGREGPLRGRLPEIRRGAAARHRHGGERLPARRRPFGHLVGAAAISTRGWAACSAPT